MKYKKCNLCLSSDQKLVKSHIIPRAFYMDIKGDDNLSMIDNKGSFPKKAPCGVYDRIVCAECEKKFGYGDNYIREFINSDFSIFEKGEYKARVYKNPDVKKLNYFVGSLLWRAHISKQDMFENVYICNKFERKIRDYLCERSPFPVEIEYFFKKFDNSKGLISPDKKKIGSLNGYRFDLGEWEIRIKVDSRSFSETLEEFADHSKGLWVMCEEYENSNKHNEMRKTAKCNKKFFLKK